MNVALRFNREGKCIVPPLFRIAFDRSKARSQVDADRSRGNRGDDLRPASQHSAGVSLGAFIKKIAGEQIGAQ
jgi:hypothetical protein